jgi:Type IV secretion system pilin
MTTIQKGLYSLVGFAATTASSFAAIDTGLGRIDSKIKGTDAGADSAIQTLISNAMVFLGILGVCYGIWGGFQIVTAGGDEEKVKKGRTIIIQVVIGLIVIFLANSIIQWVLTAILK